MKRMGGWLSGATPSTSSKSMTALDERAALQNAMSFATLIINDDIERAEAELSKGTSPFHKLGRATAVFLRAALGFEKEVMAQAGTCIAEAEESAAEYQRRAIRDPSTAHHSKIYPVGSEYALCHAETQLMSAVVAVLTESLTESLKGFYKLRKAFTTLYEISEAEKTYLRSNGKQAAGSLSSGTTPSEPRMYEDEDEDEFEFVDAEDDTGNSNPPKAYEGHLSYSETTSPRQSTALEELHGNSNAPRQMAGVEVDSGGAAMKADNDIDFTKVTSDPIDLFIHSGTALCFGLLQLLLSLVPPAFSKVLSIFSFRGDREEGLRLLWRATRFKKDVNGAMAGLITLGFHNGLIGACDILPKDALPEDKLRSLLSEMRELYPKSKLWLLEESRTALRDRRPDDAIELIAHGRKSQLKQVEALGQFEMSLDLMYVHRYADCATSFITCVGLNNWSHALYYYIAGTCHVELYRSTKLSNPTKAAEHAATADKHLHEVLSHTSKKRFMGRQLPFDVFTSRKIAKWDARAKSRGCSFVDAVGISPLLEMVYFWSGFGKMRVVDLEKSLEILTRAEENRETPLRLDSADDVDEYAILHLLRGVVLLNLGNIAEAKSALTEHVTSQTLAKLKLCEHADTWPIPCAHYEMAVCFWKEAGGEGGDRALLKRSSEHLVKVERAESFELEARIGLKVATARQTLKRAGIAAA